MEAAYIGQGIVADIAQKMHIAKQNLTIEEKLLGSKILDMYMIINNIKYSLSDYSRHFTEYFMLHGISWPDMFLFHIKNFLRRWGDFYIQYMAMKEAKEQKQLKLKVAANS